MTFSEALTKAHELQLEWVGSPEIGGPRFDLDRIHASILQEIRWNKKRPDRCTPACASRTRGHAILLGKIRKILTAEVA